jgi:hypothetical protein
VLRALKGDPRTSASNRMLTSVPGEPPITEQLHICCDLTPEACRSHRSTAQSENETPGAQQS